MLSAVTLKSGQLLVSTCYSSPCTLEASRVHFLALKFFFFFITPVSWQRVRLECLLYSLNSLVVQFKTAQVLVHYSCFTLKMELVVGVLRYRRFATHACSERRRSWSLRVKYLLGEVAIVSINVANMLTVESVQHKETLICCHTEVVSLCINSCVVHFKSDHN